MSVEGYRKTTTNRRRHMPTVVTANYDAFFRTRPDDRVNPIVVSKCMKLGPRVLALANGPEDVALLYVEPDARHVSHLARRFGFVPRIIWPGKVSTKPLDLAAAARQDGVMRRLEQLGRPSDWRLRALLSDSSTAGLARQAGFRLAGTDAELVKRGLVRRLNRKALFFLFCLEHELPVPPRQEVYSSLGHLDAQCHVRELISQTAGAVIRLDIAAGGLGNRKFETMAEFDTFLEEERAKQASEWLRQPVLVAELIPDSCKLGEYSVVANVTDSGYETVAYVKRMVNNLESTGNVLLLSPPAVAEIFGRHVRTYFSHLYEVGFRGEADVDIIHYSWYGDECVAFCESNARALLNFGRTGRSPPHRPALGTKAHFPFGSL